MKEINRIFIISIAAILTMGLVMVACHAESKPYKMGRDDANELRADEAELQNLQTQLSAYTKSVQDTAAPILAARNAVRAKVCGAAHIPTAECIADPKTGEVTRQVPPKDTKK